MVPGKRNSKWICKYYWNCAKGKPIDLSATGYVKPDKFSTGKGEEFGGVISNVYTVRDVQRNEEKESELETWLVY